MDTPKRPKVRRCKNCKEPVELDRYGELIHAETQRYSCGDDPLKVAE